MTERTETELNYNVERLQLQNINKHVNFSICVNNKMKKLFIFTLLKYASLHFNIGVMSSVKFPNEFQIYY